MHPANTLFKCWRCGSLNKNRFYYSDKYYNYAYIFCDACQRNCIADRYYGEGLEFNAPKKKGGQSVYYKEQQ